MIAGVVRGSLAARVLVLAVAVGLVVLGATRMGTAKVDLLPEFGPVQVAIQTEALGLSAAEVEQLITVPIEADLLNGVAWLDQIRSESVAGLSSIELIFEPGTDVQEARQVVAERLTQAHALPNVSRPPAMLQPLSSTSRVMMVGLSSDELSLMDLSVLARWKIRPRLTGVPGVANVAIWGQRERQLQVQVDPERLSDNGVSLVQVMRTTGNALWVSPLSFVEASTPGSGGFIETPNQRMGVQHISPISTAADLAQVTVEDTDGRTLRLSDVATVVEGSQPLIGDAVVDDGPSLMLVIEKFPGASTLDVTKGLEDAFAALAPGLSGVTIDTSLYRPATTIESALDQLCLALLIGLGLLLLLLGLLFFDWRATLLAAVTIPLCLLAAGLVLHLRGTTFNVMTAAGLLLALGIVIDDAVMDADTIRRRVGERRQRADGKPIAAVITEAAIEVRRPTVFATLIVLAAAAPLLLLDDLTAAFAGPLLLSFGLAVLASTLVGLTLTPVLALVLFARAPVRRRRRESPIVRWFQARSDGLLSQTSRRSGPWLVVTGAVAIGAVVLVPLLGSPGLVPTLRERVVLIQWDGAPGTSQPEMARVAAAATAEFRSLPGVRSVGAHVGRAITSDEVASVNESDLWVSVEPDADYDQTVAAIGQVVDGYPGLFREVQTYPEEQVLRALTGSDDDLVVRVYGQDSQVLDDLAAEVRELIAGIDGVGTPRTDVQAAEPTIEIEVDLDRAEAEGIKPGDVRRAAATLVNGVEVGSLFEDQKVFEVVVWGVPEIRDSVTGVGDLLIDKPGGGQVRLGDVADVAVAGNPNLIKRDSVSRRVDVSADVDGDPDAVIDQVHTALAQIDFPLEYHAEVLEREDQGSQNPVILALAAAIGAFLLLQLGLGSWRVAAVVFLALPVALAGGWLAALVDGGEVTLAALAGMLTVLGIALRSAVVSIKQYDRLRALPGGGSDLEAVRRGSAERIVPVMATTLGTALVLLPLVLLGDAPGLEVIRPGAIVVIAGLVTTALFSLVVLPLLYLRFTTPTSGEAHATQ